ncbi:MAG: response regulator [Myxococcales bacterium]|nr:response regulator [Myxococcales bacterium]
MRADRPRLLLVEDDPRLAELVREYLTQQGFAVAHEARGDRAVERILAEPPDLVILDLMLPGLDGLSVCRQIRPRYTGGVLMLTARGDEVDEVVGLEVGADDYLAKPVRPRLLLAHVNALLRRVSAPPDPAVDQRLGVGDLVIDAGARSVTVAGAPVSLTTAEFDLLWFLAERAGEVVAREVIYPALRGIEYDGLDRSMDLRVARLRRKLGDDAQDPRRLKSVRGVGYLLARDP